MEEIQTYGKNEIYSGGVPKSWKYIDSQNRIYSITEENNGHNIVYVIRCFDANEPKTPIVLQFWWDVIEYFETID